MRKYYPNYSIGTDAYADIPMVCEKYGTKAVIIGGTHALAAAADLIKEAVADSNIMITGVFEYGGEASREHIDELNSHQEVIDADMIFACGPTPMLRAIKNYAEANGIECYISLEERMACGIGACLACVCKSREKDAHSNVNNKRICKDGPVFLSTEVEI